MFGEAATSPSGLKYKDIKVGDGMQPADWVPGCRRFLQKNEQASLRQPFLEKGKPNDVRVTGDPTSANVIPGLDDGRRP